MKPKFLFALVAFAAVFLGVSQNARANDITLPEVVIVYDLEESEFLTQPYWNYVGMVTAMDRDESCFELVVENNDVFCAARGAQSKVLVGKMKERNGSDEGLLINKVEWNSSVVEIIQLPRPRGGISQRLAIKK